jgi:dinuclear metal center YbgI/SA1388 family protein
MTTVGDIISIIEQDIADPHLAESWDNCGLQVGDRNQPVSKIVTALDPLESVVDYACSINADLLITHHPLIFKPLTNIDWSTPMGRIISRAHDHKLAIYSAHTNLDSAEGGLNDMFARKMGMIDLRVLGRPVEDESIKLVIFAPKDHKDTILGALAETPAGIIGNYTCCSFLCSGEGRYKPGSGSEPFKGKIGEISSVDELKIETIVSKRDVRKVVDHVARVHPYETMAYDLYPLGPQVGHEGMGRIGSLEIPVPFKDFVKKIKTVLGLPLIKVAGNLDAPVRTVALCTGSGSSMLKDFLKSPADVYVSGDLHYHDARTVEEAGRAMIDVGHFASEIIVAEAMSTALESLCKKKGYSIQVTACAMERDPFIYA